MTDVNSSLMAAVRTGKVVFGLRETLSEVERGRAKMIVVASNCPREKFEQLRKKSQMSNIPVYVYSGSRLDLGLDCGKPFSISVLAIRDAGDSDILKLVEE